MNLDQVVLQARCAFNRVSERTWCVNPAVPILFFGDLDAYRASPLRVLTVGLNPSLHEFPSDRPFRRFPLVEGSLGREPSRYLDAMSSYFRTEPYSSWFSAFEPLLNGAGASYYDGESSTALHTDICSPVATSPTWSSLSDWERSALEAEGGALWHGLLAALRPQIVALSIARRHLDRIEFEPVAGGWELVHVFTRTGSGAERSRPYEVRTRWYQVGNAPSLFVFGPAAQKPFGLLHDSQKRELGPIMLEAYRDGR